MGDGVHDADLPRDGRCRGAASGPRPERMRDRTCAHGCASHAGNVGTGGWVYLDLNATRWLVLLLRDLAALHSHSTQQIALRHLHICCRNC